MNRERLEIQIDILRNIKPEKFHMGSWMQSPNNEPCGTTCCAFGYAALDKRMQEHGLIMAVTFYNHLKYFTVRTVEEFNELVVRKAKDGARLRAAMPSFNGGYDYTAAQEFFDISDGEAQHLFNPERYVNSGTSAYLIKPQDVIDRIERLLKTEQVGFV